MTAHLQAVNVQAEHLCAVGCSKNSTARPDVAYLACIISSISISISLFSFLFPSPSPSYPIQSAIELAFSLNWCKESPKMSGTPEPIDPSYVPAKSAVSISANAPIEEILAIIERDGGVILTDLVSSEDLAAIDKELEPWALTNSTLENAPVSEELNFFSPETRVIPGLVGKSPTVAKFCECAAMEKLRNSILLEKFGVAWEDGPKEFTIDPLLSLSATFDIGYGAPRQRLHRDDYTHAARHGGNFNLSKAGQFTCMVAATRFTRENGATMFIPGSHKWDDSRVAKPDEVCFVGRFMHPICSDIFAQNLSPDLYQNTIANIEIYRNGTRLRFCFSCLLLSCWRT